MGRRSPGAVALRDSPRSNSRGWDKDMTGCPGLCSRTRVQAHRPRCHTVIRSSLRLLKGPLPWECGFGAQSLIVLHPFPHLAWLTVEYGGIKQRKYRGRPMVISAAPGSRRRTTMVRVTFVCTVVYLESTAEKTSAQCRRHNRLCHPVR